MQVCRAEACQARGADGLLAKAAEIARRHRRRGRRGVLPRQLRARPVGRGRRSACTAGVDEVALGTIITRASQPVEHAEHAESSAPATSDGGTVVYVPRDAAARAAGADEVAAALAAAAGRRASCATGRAGCCGSSRWSRWRPPQGRVAYGPVSAADVPGLMAAGLLTAAITRLRLGVTEQLPWMARQQRVTFRRVGVVDPRSLDDYEAHGGLVGLRRALAMQPGDVVTEVADSGLRGRGGAAFPTGIKWRTVLDAAGPTKYIACNADEGDSGTFADRMLMEGDPFMLLEGMTIAGWAVGANDGYVYIRSEYPDAIEALRAAIAAAEAKGWLGDDVLGSGFAFRVHVRVGAGAYICGEETAMLESLEGKRGVVRAKPPLPALEGLFGKPTVVNNVLSLATVPADPGRRRRGLRRARAPAAAVAPRCSSWPATSPAAASSRPPSASRSASSSTTSAAARASGRPVRAVQVGGPLGVVPAQRSSSTCRWTTRHSPPPTRCSATAASWCSTTPSTWPRRRGSRWSSARSSRAASARRAASAAPAASS